MSRKRREFVRKRAGHRCEYCHLPDFEAPISTFHVEHIVARQHLGPSDITNLCWCCNRCNLHKGPNLSGRDPLSTSIVRLFNPRRQAWNRHFEWFGAILVGRTKTGRATVAVLNINDHQRVDLRRILRENDEWQD